MQEAKKPNRAIITIVVVVLLAIAVAGVAYVTKDSATTSEAGSPSATSTTAPDVGTGNVPSSSYNNGTYSATGEYRTPEGQQSIDVTVALSDGTISEITATGNANSGTSQQYQGMFESGYKAEVVGKNINEVDLTRVAGSSLTPQGFNDAISKIKDEARA